MSFNLLVPSLENKPKNSKDAIISILTEKWPLSLREIYYAIKKQYAFSSSYQAVFKAVGELKDKKVLVCKNKKYSINISWIKELQSFTDIIETNYYATNKLNNLDGLKSSKRDSDLIVLNFDNIFDSEKYLYYFMKTELSKKKNETVCYQLINEWRPLFYLRSEFNYYTRLMEKGHQFYFTCSGGNEIEKMCQKFYKSIGAKYKFVKNKFNTDTIVFGDYFIQIFVPSKIRQRMQKCLENKDIITLLTDVMSEKAEIRVIISKDKGMVTEISEEIVNSF